MVLRIALLLTVAATSAGAASPTPPSTPDSPQTAAAEAESNSLPPPIPPRDEHSGEGRAGSHEAEQAAGDAPFVPAPDIVVTAAVEPSSVTFGEPFALVVTVLRPAGLRVELPARIPEVDSAPRTGEPVRSVETRPSPSAADGPKSARVRETIRIPFLALDTDAIQTPAFSLRAPDGTALDVPSLSVTVLTPDASKADDDKPGTNITGLAAAEPDLTYAVLDLRPWLVLAGIAAIAGTVLILRRLMHARRMRARANPRPSPPQPAHVIALERLDALLASGLLGRGDTSLFVERLMDDVLRDYITARFALSAGTRTTRELVQDLLLVRDTGVDVSHVEALLADADLVKFAQARIAAPDAHAMAGRVRAFIERTAQIAPASTSGTAVNSLQGKVA